MDGQSDHLRDGRAAGDGAVVGWVLPVAAFEDQNRPPFKDLVVLFIPLLSDLPLDHLLHKLIHSFLDAMAFLDVE